MTQAAPTSLPSPQAQAPCAHSLGPPRPCSWQLWVAGGTGALGFLSTQGPASLGRGGGAGCRFPCPCNYSPACVREVSMLGSAWPQWQLWADKRENNGLPGRLMCSRFRRYRITISNETGEHCPHDLSGRCGEISASPSIRCRLGPCASWPFKAGLNYGDTGQQVECTAGGKADTTSCASCTYDEGDECAGGTLLGTPGAGWPRGGSALASISLILLILPHNGR